MPYLSITYQIIFSTKNRQPIMLESGHETIYKYLFGLLQQKKCFVYAINGTEDHLHVIIELHPSVALADLVKDIKVSLSLLIKTEKIYEDWMGWQEGYGAFTYSKEARARLITYVNNQKEHHRKESSRDEYIRMLNENGIEANEKYIL